MVKWGYVLTRIVENTQARFVLDLFIWFSLYYILLHPSCALASSTIYHPTRREGLQAYVLYIKTSFLHVLRIWSRRSADVCF
ncbi:hypothetical protein BJ165DRAFT_1519170 [Panaeolus papilionaceus]|nr:hypothetical protein BJ165DRAFT_1519170 [Panaeolus papilionaceus]